MKTSTKKYFILAVAGALIIGTGIYLFLNNYFERVDIVVAKNAIQKDKQLEEQDLKFSSYYRHSLPGGYVSGFSEVIGKTLVLQRLEGDPITQTVFEHAEEKNMLESLNAGEVMTALNIDYIEPVVSRITAGSKISIISTEKEKNFEIKPQHVNSTDVHGNILDIGSFSLSENVLIIDGQLIIKNIEVIHVEKAKNSSPASFASNQKESIYIFIKCKIKEAPVISRVTKNNNYKIFLERQ